jgi:hypothetical protein
LEDSTASFRSREVFFYYCSNREDEPFEEATGVTKGGETIWGRLAMMQVKLGLTQKELMNTPWISLVMATNDFPWYDHKGKKVIRGKAASEYLDKYVSK